MIPKHFSAYIDHMNDSNNKKSCLTKADLGDAIFSLINVDKHKASDIVEDFIELIKAGLTEDGKVMVSGFGSFEVKDKPPRRGRNPQTGESIILRARKVVKFKPSQILRKAINNDNSAIDNSSDAFL